MTEMTPENKTKKIKKVKKTKRPAESDASSTEDGDCPVPKKQKKEKKVEVNGNEETDAVAEVSIPKKKKEKKVKKSEESDSSSADDAPKKKKEKTSNLNGTSKLEEAEAGKTQIKKEKKKKRSADSDASSMENGDCPALEEAEAGKTQIKKEKKKKRSADSDSSSMENGDCPVPKKQKKVKKVEVNGTDAVAEVSILKKKKEKTVKTEESDHSSVDEGKQKKEKNTSDVEETKEISPEEKDGAISNFRISHETAKKMKESGVKYLFPVQAKTFDHVYDGYDLITKARTGTGKTYSFAIPLVEVLQKNLTRQRGRPPKVLCMVPTRELASQVASNFSKLASGLEVLCVYGGTPYYPQESALRNGVDIVVGTPGRINDLVGKKRLVLTSLNHVVLDEVDRMLDMGFSEIVDQILQVAYTDREKSPQTLLFSATLPRWVYEMSQKYMKNEVKKVDMVGTERVQTSTTVQHLAMKWGYHDRAATIGDVLKVYSGKHGRSIVFCDQKRDADELAQSSFIQTDNHVLHGDIPQSTRELVLQGFRDGRYKCLITTDVSARGLDIPEVDLVIQNHPPKDIDSYVHRSGRTGRAGRDGICVCFYSHPEMYALQAVERKIGLQFKHVDLPSTADLLEAGNKDAIRILDNVDSKIVERFEQAAEKLLSDRTPVAVVAAALAIISGTTEVTNPALESSREGYTKYVFRTNRVIKHLTYVWTFLNRNLSDDKLERILDMTFCADKMGAVFDVPEDLVPVLDKWPRSYNSILARAIELPKLEQGGMQCGQSRSFGGRRGSFGGRSDYGRGQNRSFGTGRGFNRGGSGYGSRGGAMNRSFNR